MIAIDLPGHGFSDATRTQLTPDLLFGTMTDALAEIRERIAERRRAIFSGNAKRLYGWD